MKLLQVSHFLSNNNTFSLLFVIAILIVMVGWIAKFERGKNKKLRTVLVGYGEVAERFITLVSASRLPYDLIGRVEDETIASEYNIDCLGRIEDIVALVPEHRIDAVVIAESLGSSDKINHVIDTLQGSSIQIIIIPDYFEFALYRPKVAELHGMPFIHLHQSALTGTDRFLKRLLDVVVSSIAILLSSPMMTIIALAIKLGSDGPVLFKQDRIGEQGKHFKIFKFRSMVVNADQLISQVKEESEDGTFIYKKKDDPRITKVGKFIRRTSLDELPQLFNVLRGEMSLVGPRPELPWLVEEYKPWQRIRFAVPQGITGWWQINGRSDKPMHLNTSEDLYYVQNYSIWLDLYILFKTPFVVLRGKGAY